MSQSSSSSALRVLVVDDHPDLLLMLDLMMQRRKYNVCTAQSGAQALQIAPEFGMPEMDGYQLMRTLRENTELAPFKAIALTGYDQQMEGNQATQAGFDSQLTKPIEFDQLFQMIEQLANGAG